MKIAQNPRIAIAGSVNSSKKVLKKLIEHKMNVVSVLGLDPEISKNVSGFKDLKPVAERGGLPFRYFKNLNDDWVVEHIKSENIDLFFVVGLSQLVREPLLSLPKYGCIGYHPTLLPEGRGRAAIAWIIFGKAKPAATFFLMDAGADSGDIIGQLPVQLNGDEYPQNVIDKIMDAISELLDELLPKIKKGMIGPQKQNESNATYLGKRTPEDGLINWSATAPEIALLVRAVSRPLPGAFTFVSGRKVIIWKADSIDTKKYIGEPGRVAALKEDEIIVHAGEGVIRIEEFEGIDLDEFKVGKKLGIDLLNISKKMNLIEW